MASQIFVKMAASVAVLLRLSNVDFQQIKPQIKLLLFFFNAVIICFIPFLWIRPAMRLRLMSPLSSAHWLQVLHRLTLIGVNALMSQSAYNYHVVHLSQCNRMICTQYHRNGSM